jgi:hypothetical protein
MEVEKAYRNNVKRLYGDLGISVQNSRQKQKAAGGEFETLLGF